MFSLVWGHPNTSTCASLCQAFGDKINKFIFYVLFLGTTCAIFVTPSNERNEKQMENMSAKFAESVLSRRKELGLTQEELAKKIGTSKQMVSKYELGQRSPKVAMANAFADALETTLDELLDIEKEIEEENKDPQIKLVESVMKEMSEDDKEYIASMVVNYAKMLKKRNIK